MIENGGVSNSSSLTAKRASDVAEAVRDGKSVTAARRENPADVFKLALEIIQSHGWDRKTSQALRRARTDQLVMSEEDSTALKAIELSQKEDGVGNPTQATQVNVYRDPPPPKAAKFFEGETIDDAEDPS